MSNQAKVTVYSTTNCGVCHAVMQWMDKQGVSYKNHVVDEDVDAMAEFMQINEGMIGTPFTVITNKDQTTKIAGFDQKKLKQALGL